MKNIELIGHQGDLIIFSTEDIIEGNRIIDKQCENKTLAYGELTGHAHQFRSDANVDVFKIANPAYDGLIFVQPKEDVILRHGRDVNFRGIEPDTEYHSELKLLKDKTYITGIVEETDWLTKTVRKVVD